ncbi:MAG: NRDE family protein [Firmicutes bacterium]|nr:NRDE family protein [Bacillota bacterium]
MCYVVFAYDCHPDYLLVLAANRDEDNARPAAPARFWEEAPDMLAGKDLLQSGTWMGISRLGRFAALTNYRDPASLKPEAPSRGRLVKDYLCSLADPLAYIDWLAAAREVYNGYNLLLMSQRGMWHYSNRTGSPLKISPGIHGLSNHLLDTPWPKVERGKARLGLIIKHSKDFAVDSLFELLYDRRQALDRDLPQTGVSLQWERLLSSIFIQSEAYGTRSSTVLLIERGGNVHFYERNFNKDGQRAGSDIVYHFPAAFSQPYSA